MVFGMEKMWGNYPELRIAWDSIINRGYIVQIRSPIYVNH